MTGPPGKPSVPDIVDWDVDRVDLKWEAPKDTGGAPITKYIIEKKERYGTWETIHESEVREEALVDALTSLYCISEYSCRKDCPSLRILHIQQHHKQ